MSATPGDSSQSPGASSPVDLTHIDDGLSKEDQRVLEYLRKNGYKAAEQEVRDALGAPAPAPNGDAKSAPEGRQTRSRAAKAKATTVPVQELVKKNAPHAQKSASDASNMLSEPQVSSQMLTSMFTSMFGSGLATNNVTNFLNNVAGTGAEDAVSSNSTDRHEGFRELEAWVDGSLDMYRPEFRPILFPIFCHFYFDLVERGFKEAATHFFRTFQPSLSTHHRPTLKHLASLLLPAHVSNDELAQRFRNEKYVLRMSRSGFGLLVGWLTEGTGGEALGTGEAFIGDGGRRGRAAVMQVVNNHISVEVASNTGTSVPSHSWEENAGLVSSLIPKVNGTATPAPGVPVPQAFNAIRNDLRLGLPPMDDGLRDEVERTLRDESVTNGEMMPNSAGGRHYDWNTLPRPFAPPPNGHPVPSAAEQLPLPPPFKIMDVRREVEKIRDARKRIRLDPMGFSADHINDLDRQASMARARALPSVCAYTFHDAADGICCSAFSPDTSLLAAGFSESYIRLWSIKGDRLKGMTSDFSMSAIKDAASIKRTKEKGGTTTRKLIGHSGPVYSLSFDPLCGSAGPPQHLLSSSADATVRLWSLETMTNLVAYRGHQNPVWSVEWSPMGVYFATGSRDRTARLWSTDRVTALRVFAGHLSDVDCVKFHPNALYIATGSSDNTCRLWDVQRGSCVRVFLGHQGPVTALAMSSDGRYLASAGEDLAINLWDLGSGRRIKQMTGHTASIYSIAFSAESTLLVSGGADWTTRCWDVKAPGGLPQRRGALDDVAMADSFGAGRQPGALPTGGLPESADEENIETADLLVTFPTKRTPIINVQFTPRNLCLVSGPAATPEQR